MSQLGFFFDADSCIGCHSCQVACKDVHRLEVGENFRHVTTYTTGSYPDVGMYHVSIACNHCVVPACLAVCPVGAISKDEETGVVLIDKDACIGCKTCISACPYEQPVFLEKEGVVFKCDSCIHLRKNDEMPACVGTCPQRVLEFGDIDELKAAHGGEELVADIVVLPDSSRTMPSLAINVKPIMLETDYNEIYL
ncbi:MAG: 4Fe-4S dicluster domain-containing protein [Coriobacteriales bacterium]|jgi:anaerobic dimethyl sulfoxide reductase subunit B (iron-sulfur subunit)|nr:4Fe-4S dicluster domain-containing protein [Coriobacteriales bacterium]